MDDLYWCHDLEVIAREFQGKCDNCGEDPENEAHTYIDADAMRKGMKEYGY